MNDKKNGYGIDVWDILDGY